MRNEEIIFFESIKNKLSEAEQKRLDEILSVYKNKKIKDSERTLKSRRNSSYQQELHKLGKKIYYYRDKGDIELMDAYVRERERLKREHEKEIKKGN